MVRAHMSLYQNKYRIETARNPCWDYSARGSYFVTICAQGRACIFGQIVEDKVQLSKIREVAERELQNLSAHYEKIEVPSCVVMPNHLHAIIAIEGEHRFSRDASVALSAKQHNAGFLSPSAGSLPAIVRSYKAGVTLQCRRLGYNQVIWQSRFHDHILRGDAGISAVSEYIRNNPVNWAQTNSIRRDVACNVSCV